MAKIRSQCWISLSTDCGEMVKGANSSIDCGPLYEDLMKDTKTQLQRMLDFLAYPYTEPGKARFCKLRHFTKNMIVNLTPLLQDI